MEERDKQLEQTLQDGSNPDGLKLDSEQTFTYKVGKLSLQGKRSQINKQKLLEEMIEEELVFGEPIKLKQYLILFCVCSAGFAFRRDFKEYY